MPERKAVIGWRVIVLNSRRDTGEAVGATEVTISPLSLIPWVDVADEPGNFRKVKVLPSYRKPALLMPVFLLKAPTICPVVDAIRLRRGSGDVGDLKVPPE